MFGGQRKIPPTIFRSPTCSSLTGERGRSRVDVDRRRGCGRLAIAVVVALPGCAVAPSVNILGSFFPAWLICIVIGVVLTILSRQVFLAMQLEPHLGPALLIYPCLAALWVFATWLLLFGG